MAGDCSTDGGRASRGPCYSLPSLTEYVLIAQDRVHVEHFLRQGGGAWLLTETDRREDDLELPSIGCRLALTEVYQRVL